MDRRLFVRKKSLFLAAVSLGLVGCVANTVNNEVYAQWGGVQTRPSPGFTPRPSTSSSSCTTGSSASASSSSCRVPSATTSNASTCGISGAASGAASASQFDAQQASVFRGDAREYDFDPLRGKGKLFPIPKTSDTRLAAILNSSRTVFYKLPRTYQNFAPGKLQLVETSDGQTRPVRQKPVFAVYFSSVNASINGGDEFPWETTFGLNATVADDGGAARYPVVDALWIPPDRRIVLAGGRLEEDGDRDFLRLDGDRPVQWIFPEGTVAMEIGYVRDVGANRFLPFEVRVREKTAGDWSVARYAPFGSRQDLERKADLAAGDLGRLPKRFFSARNVRETEIFNEQDVLEQLPELPAETVRGLLSRAFDDVTNVAFSAETSIPTTEADFGPVPKHYMLGIAGMATKTNCVSCHALTGASVARIDSREPSVRSNPQKAGLIRGYDGVLSWHPFRVDSIAASETSEPLSRVELRAGDFRRRLVEVARETRDYPHNRFFKSHDADLAGWELPPKRFMDGGARSTENVAAK
jgi:hypothetical protein